jgi:hypothetical protein
VVTTSCSPTHNLDRHAKPALRLCQIAAAQQLDRLRIALRLHARRIPAHPGTHGFRRLGRHQALVDDGRQTGDAFVGQSRQPPSRTLACCSALAGPP